jgi:hypothetical protein
MDTTHTIRFIIDNEVWPKSVYMFDMTIVEWTAIMLIYSINLLSFLTQTKYVYYEAGPRF